MAGRVGVGAVVRHLVVPAAVLAMAVGCSSDDGGHRDGGSRESVPLNGTDLTGAELCEMVPTTEIEERFELEIGELTPLRISLRTVTGASCGYHENGAGRGVPPAVQTGVHIVRVDGLSSLDFTFGGFDEKGQYQEVTDLGDAAGFGPVPLNGPHGGQMLAVVTNGDGESRTITVKVNQQTTVEQTRPIAERLLAGLDG